MFHEFSHVTARSIREQHPSRHLRLPFAEASRSIRGPSLRRLKPWMVTLSVSSAFGDLHLDGVPWHRSSHPMTNSGDLHLATLPLPPNPGSHCHTVQLDSNDSCSRTWRTPGVVSGLSGHESITLSSGDASCSPARVALPSWHHPWW